MDEIEFDSLYAAARTYQDRRLGAGSLCDRCDHGHIYRRRGARDVAVCRSAVSFTKACLSALSTSMGIVASSRRSGRVMT
jgi:hypothetical protein